MTDDERALGELIGRMGNTATGDERMHLFGLLLNAACVVYVQSASDPWDAPKEAEDLMAEVAREAFRHVLETAKKFKRNHAVA